MVGKKTAQSLRRVPLPAAVLPYLPKAIKGPLFDRSKNPDPSDASSKRLNRFLDDSGIVDKRKVVHSFRHRAADRLRTAECPEDIRWSIRWKSCDSCNDQRETASEVMTVTSNQPHAAPLAVREDAEAVVLDLMKPARSRRRVRRQAWQARIETGVGLIATQPVPKLTPY
jgi:hypothetical protein